MILVRDNMMSRQISANITCNDAFNICSVDIRGSSLQLLVMVVYRAPWASIEDTIKISSPS